VSTEASARGTTAQPLPAQPTIGQQIVRVLTTTDHKIIGKLYVGTSLFWFMAAGIMALLIRS